MYVAVLGCSCRECLAHYKSVDMATQLLASTPMWRLAEQSCPKPQKQGYATVPLSCAAELTTTMTELGGLLTAEEISKFVSIMDTDNNGVVGVSDASSCADRLLWQLASAQGRMLCS